MHCDTWGLSIINSKFLRFIGQEGMAISPPSVNYQFPCSLQSILTVSTMPWQRWSCQMLRNNCWMWQQTSASMGCKSLLYYTISVNMVDVMFWCLPYKNNINEYFLLFQNCIDLEKVLYLFRALLLICRVWCRGYS